MGPEAMGTNMLQERERNHGPLFLILLVQFHPPVLFLCSVNKPLVSDRTKIMTGDILATIQSQEIAFQRHPTEVHVCANSNFLEACAQKL